MKTVALLYHELERENASLCSSDPGYRLYCIRDVVFERQMRALANQGFRGTSVGDWAAGRGPAFEVVITFDDGCASDLEVAAPALERAGFTATFFVTAGRIGATGFMSAAQLRELRDRGFEIGSHGLTHRYLTALDPDGLVHELTESRHRLEDVLGAAVWHLSYPGGRVSRRVVRAARAAGYHTASTSGIGMNSLLSDAFQLRRICVTRGTTDPQLVRFIRGDGLLVPQLRSGALAFAKRALGDVRYERLRATILRRKRNVAEA